MDLLASDGDEPGKGGGTVSARELGFGMTAGRRPGVGDGFDIATRGLFLPLSDSHSAIVGLG